MYRSLIPSTLFALLLVAACTAPKETAVVTVRPEPVASTEGTTPTALRPAVALTPFPAGYDTVRAQRFDGGKMWTFDNPPLDYFEQAYGFKPDEAWFSKARAAALRFSSYCSASFVSPNGLVMTNHHCARESISAVSKAGENLLDNGFLAAALEQERKVEDLYVDQLIEIKDVTEEVYAAMENATGDDAQAEARSQKAEQLEQQMTSTVKSTDSTRYVQVISLYNGGKYSAYTFRRYEDVRLVMAPELLIGFYGGDPDNFTYPRYNFDMSFFRVYGEEGKPLQSSDYFAWSPAGTTQGEPVFVVGNPGSTSRLSTISQLEYERDYALPRALEVLKTRSALMRSYIDANPEKAEEYKLRNDYFALKNAIKSNSGQLRGLQDPYLMARRTAAERALQEGIAASDSLSARYGDVYEEIAAMQRFKVAMNDQAAAFTYMFSPMLSSRILNRALYGYVYALMKQRSAPRDRVEDILKDAQEIKGWPAEVEKGFIALRLQDLQTYLGEDDPTVRRLLGTLTPTQVADSIVTKTALMDSTRYAEVLENGYLNSKDPTVEVINALAPLFFSLDGQMSDLQSREDNFNAKLARAQFTLFGDGAPPDASFSLRIADGVVKGYNYNGTRAPVYTTLYGLYDHYYAYQRTHQDWQLPERWRTRPEGLVLSTPVNLVTTNDITGGNSGSPLLNQNLEVVGLVFDSNIEALPNEYLYRDIAGRAISVDSRGMLGVLDDVYEADALVEELRTGQLMATEQASGSAVNGGGR